MKKLLMLLLVNVAWDSKVFSQAKIDTVIGISDLGKDTINNGYGFFVGTTGRLYVDKPQIDTLTASLLVTHNRRGIAHPHDGFVLTENGIVIGEYLDVNKHPIKKPYTVWHYQLGVVHTPRRLGRTSLCH